MTPIIWLLGLSGSGKTTLGSLLRLYLDGQGIDAEFIDADNFCRSRGLSTETPQQRVRNTDTLRDYALSLQASGKTWPLQYRTTSRPASRKPIFSFCTTGRTCLNAQWRRARPEAARPRQLQPLPPITTPGPTPWLKARNEVSHGSAKRRPVPCFVPQGRGR
jgi:Adenylylsulfate kinase and related kinases